MSEKIPNLAIIDMGLQKGEAKRGETKLLKKYMMRRTM